MSNAPIDYAGNKGLGWLFIIIILIFVVGSFVFTTNNTFEEQNVIDNLDSMIYAVESLQYGDTQGFIEGIIGSIPVIAVFFVVFGIVHFISSTALKKLFKTKNVILAFSLVVTLYAFINQKIYNYIISLNAFTVGLLVFFLLIIMLWGFGKHGWNEYKPSHDALYNKNDGSLKKLKEALDALNETKNQK